ncbi:uncharacterized protein LOC130636723 [Hydractinia symbiolongicarpus]|uniref:uncharacterized protein LOC130636723 n=1 Tax=Hydractinia symbiolongicarpus TaxID=13093 RepID=UPI00254BE243|nr:uncharacterized protein LOC130636723 [Hydractinia symbiolongicarpus]
MSNKWLSAAVPIKKKTCKQKQTVNRKVQQKYPMFMEPFSQALNTSNLRQTKVSSFFKNHGLSRRSEEQRSFHSTFSMNRFTVDDKCNDAKISTARCDDDDEEERMLFGTCGSSLLEISNFCESQGTTKNNLCNIIKKISHEKSNSKQRKRMAVTSYIKPTKETKVELLEDFSRLPVLKSNTPYSRDKKEINKPSSLKNTDSICQEFTQQSPCVVKQLDMSIVHPEMTHERSVIDDDFSPCCVNLEGCYGNELSRMGCVEDPTKCLTRERLFDVDSEVKNNDGDKDFFKGIFSSQTCVTGKQSALQPSPSQNRHVTKPPSPLIFTEQYSEMNTNKRRNHKNEAMHTIATPRPPSPLIFTEPCNDTQNKETAFRPPSPLQFARRRLNNNSYTIRNTEEVVKQTTLKKQLLEEDTSSLKSESSRIDQKSYVEFDSGTLVKSNMLKMSGKENIRPSCIDFHKKMEKETRAVLQDIKYNSCQLDSCSPDSITGCIQQTLLRPTRQKIALSNGFQNRKRLDLNAADFWTT